ncbi:MAG: acyl-CoA dehydrogenase [Acidimicrobiales bacterium]
MSYAITDDHRSLADVARDLLATRDMSAAHRATLGASTDRLPDHWNEIAELGWLGLHLSEEVGGAGYDLAELAVILFESGYAVAPGPLLSTVVVSSFLASTGADPSLLPGLASGEVIGGFGLGGQLEVVDDTVTGPAGLVLGAELASVLVVPVGNDVAVIDTASVGVSVAAVDNLDTSRRVAAVTLDATPATIVPGAANELRRLARVLGSAELAGTARACVDRATTYAKERVQFGRVIGSFQAVKHHLANMLVASELAVAAAWGAARPGLTPDEADIGAAIAASLALPAAVECAELHIQILGGIGFTWEHDAHFFLRRAHAGHAVLAGDGTAKAAVATLAAAGVRAQTGYEVEGDTDALREECRAFIETYRGLRGKAARRAIADSGFLVPHWPTPYGRSASPIEQLVIDEEFEGIPRPNLGISGWNTLTILNHGTDDQIERWIWPSLHGDIDICQLYSEPEAGSDAAGVKTRGVRVEGGWKVTGQKVWTTGGHLATHGFATVRTDPDAPKHQGISMMVIEMDAPGVEVRPLKQITGEAHFNEIFFDDVFVPDDDVVGPVNGGWTAARANLGNERVSIGASSGARPQPNLIALLQQHAPDDAGMRREVGALVAADAAAALINVRRVIRSVEGGEPGAEGAVTKLLGSVIGQERARVAARLVGESMATVSAGAGDPATFALQARSSSIAGGTSEIVRNQIAERVLGLPREPNLS